MDQTLVKKLTSSVSLMPFGLVERSADGAAVPAKEMDEIARIGLPMFALVLMFMSVMTGAMHLLNAIIEEKMSKISEVLLGSVTPFQLLAGKLVGVVAVSLLLTLVYLVGGIYALLSFGRLDLIDPVLIGWFLVFMVCAALMFGAIFLAIGSACSDLKDSQSMVQPAMMLIILAYLASFVVMRAPESGIVRGPVDVPDDYAVRDDAAAGDAARTPALAGARVGGAADGGHRGCRLGGRPHLPRRPADAGQAAEHPGAAEMDPALNWRCLRAVALAKAGRDERGHARRRLTGLDPTLFGGDTMTRVFRSAASAAIVAMSLTASAPLAAQAPADRAAAQRADRAAVEQAALDYVEALYNADTTRIERSVHPQLTKRGFWRDNAKLPWGPQTTMTYEQLMTLTKTWNADKKRDTSIKKVDVFDVLDQTATAKVTAMWGVDYLHLAKYDGRWKIINIVWQAHPENRRGDFRLRKRSRCLAASADHRSLGEGGRPRPAPP